MGLGRHSYLFKNLMEADNAEHKRKMADDVPPECVYL